MQPKKVISMLVLLIFVILIFMVKFNRHKLTREQFLIAGVALTLSIFVCTYIIEKKVLRKNKNIGRNSLLDTYQRQGYKELVRYLRDSAQKCLRIISKNKADSQIKTYSKLGGIPDLPNQQLWPCNNGKSLSFLAQINFEELPNGWSQTLPSKGMIYFFYDVEQSPWGFDPKEKDGFKVIYTDTVPRNTAIEFPADLDDYLKLNEKLISFEEDTSFPDLEIIIDDNLKINEEVLKIYQQYLESKGPLHQLLGYEKTVQGDMTEYCQLASNGVFCGDFREYKTEKAKRLLAETVSWRLLLQLDTDGSAGMMWGDCGRLYFWIKEDDLKNMRFEKTWCVLQCS